MSQPGRAPTPEERWGYGRSSPALRWRTNERPDVTLLIIVILLVLLLGGGGYYRRGRR